MKPAITIKAAILLGALAAGQASAQSPSIIQNTRSQMNAVSNHATAASNEALGIPKNVPAQAKTNPGTPAAPSKSAMPTPPAANSANVKKPTKHGVGAVLAVPAPAPTKPVAEPFNAKVPAAAAPAPSAQNAVVEQSVTDEGKYAAANGRRDPFVSPVVTRAGGSGCSTGKKCLEIGTINLRGVVRSENGFIAVVSNGVNKAYFLRENDPVFDGYVVKITGDSIVFQETLQDRLGKSFTREVVKKITAPAV